MRLRGVAVVEAALDVEATGVRSRPLTADAGRAGAFIVVAPSTAFAQPGVFFAAPSVAGTGRGGIGIDGPAAGL